MTDWPILKKLLDAGDMSGLVGAAQGLTDDRRKELVKPLQVYERALRADWIEPDEDGWYWPSLLEVRQVRALALAVAGAAVLPSPSALATWLTRSQLAARYVHHEEDLPALLLDVLLARKVPWLLDLAHRLAGQTPHRTRRLEWGQPQMIWRLVAELTRACDAELPATDGFVLAWNRPRLRSLRGSIAESIRRDHRFLRVIPRLFEVDGVRLSEQWTTTLEVLAAEGLLDRAMLLDGCLAGLQRGRTPGDARPFLDLLRGLEPTPDEVDVRHRDYVTLLPGAHSTVAAMAQAALRGLDESGRLDAETLDEVSRAVFLRKEKKLVRAQLAWLEAVLARNDNLAGSVLRAVPDAFGHPADIQKQALDLVLRYVDRTDPAVRAELAEAAEQLAPDLRQRAADAFGVPADQPVPEPVRPTAQRPRRRAIPSPLVSPSEVAGAVGELFGWNARSQLDPVALEQVLAGLVTFACHQPGALRAALAKELPNGPFPALSTSYLDTEPVFAIYAAIQRPGAPLDLYDFLGRLTDRSLPGPTVWLAYRLYEIAARILRDPRPLLLSTPTEASGLLDPGELVTRLEQLSAAGCEPWPYDFAQALLRLPQQVDRALVRRVEPLARWLDDPASPPIAKISQAVWSGLLRPETTTADAARRRYARFAQRSDPMAEDRWLPCWPALLPTRREITADHLFALGYVRGRLLWLLAEVDGSVSPSMNRLLCHGFDRRDLADRAAAVEAVELIAGTDGFDGTGLGEAVGELAKAGDVALQRVVLALRDLTTTVPPRLAWDVLCSAVAHALPSPGERPVPALADLLQLAVEVALTAGPGSGRVPGLEEIAGRGGRSRFVEEARRLVSALA